MSFAIFTNTLVKIYRIFILEKKYILKSKKKRFATLIIFEKFWGTNIVAHTQRLFLCFPQNQNVSNQNH